MTIIEAIKSRHSVRKYIDKPIDSNLIATLQQKVDEVNRLGKLNIQLVINEPSTFKGKMAYGSFSGVSNYFAMIGQKSDNLLERIGYYGEQLVLIAETLGLNTCWVGLTYNKVKGFYTIGNDEKLCCVIALGYGNDPGRNTKKKSISQLSNVSDSTPQWFRNGVEAAALAPTAVNQQKFKFNFLSNQVDGKHQVKATNGISLVGYTQIDLGIAKYHFEIGADKDNFEWI